MSTRTHQPEAHALIETSWYMMLQAVDLHDASSRRSKAKVVLIPTRAGALRPERPTKRSGRDVRTSRRVKQTSLLPFFDLYDAISPPSGYAKAAVTNGDMVIPIPCLRTTEITWSPFPLAQPRIPPIQASGTGFTPFADEAIDAVQTEKARRWRSFQRIPGRV
ncbi:hypothetical protein FRC02_006417 [Tulasnella sp. 418]|nr:hypothetical protein FRC02_006417 [Tulasnella sp. 418]